MTKTNRCVVDGDVVVVVGDVADVAAVVVLAGSRSRV